MPLKKAIFTFTKQNGETVEREATIKKVVFHYDEQKIETIYELFPDAFAKSKGATATLASQTVAVDLTDQEDLKLILAASDRIWDRNWTAPFITDYSELDENGKMVANMKSFEQLKARFEDVV